MNLVEINKELNELLDAIQDNGGVITLEVEKALSELEIAQAKKIGAIASIISHEEERIEAIKKETNRLSALKKISENKIEWLKKYLSYAVGEGNKYDGGTFKISWRKATSVIIDEGIEVPKGYCRHIPEKFEPDKKALKEALNIGAIIPGVSLKEEQHIQIK